MNGVRASKAGRLRSVAAGFANQLRYDSRPRVRAYEARKVATGGDTGIVGSRASFSWIAVLRARSFAASALQKVISVKRFWANSMPQYLIPSEEVASTTPPSVSTTPIRATSSGWARRIQRVPVWLPVSSLEVARKRIDRAGLRPVCAASRATSIVARSWAMVRLFMS